MKSQEPSTEEEENLPFRELVGALTSLAISTRPDISFAVSCMGQFNNCYRKEHWIAANRVLRYLIGTSHLGLSYGEENDSLRGFVDADWDSCPNDRRSYTECFKHCIKFVGDRSSRGSVSVCKNRIVLPGDSRSDEQASPRRTIVFVDGQ